MAQVAAHLIRNPDDGIRLLLNPLLAAALTKKAETDPLARDALACLSGTQILTTIKALAFMFQAHMSWELIM